MGSSRTIFVWGLRRSGNHLFVNWLYNNLGGRDKRPLQRTEQLHPQLRDGFCDPDRNVHFFNDCGIGKHFDLGRLGVSDFLEASEPRETVIFGIEDCDLACAERVPRGSSVSHALILRDPLNTIASRLRASHSRPHVFRVDRGFVALYAIYSEEFLGVKSRLDGCTRVAYNEFCVSRSYRDAIAAEFDIENHDEIREVPRYGGGSSFGSHRIVDDVRPMMRRYLDYPVPISICRSLLAEPAIAEVCRRAFSYDLEDRIMEIKNRSDTIRRLKSGVQRFVARMRRLRIMTARGMYRVWRALPGQ